MCLQRSEKIGNEANHDGDQFFKIEQGEEKVHFHRKVVHDEEAVIVPAGTFHKEINTGRGRLNGS
jgi:mannose-6-phosphate isomerase-like protein (cupin superfamily)